MNDEQQIISEISRLTSTIEADFPELYRFLDENPITIPSTAHPNLTALTLAEYLEDLKGLLRRHQEIHKTTGHERS